MIENLIGFVAAGFISVNLIPQIWKSLKTKKSEDVSLIMLIFVLIGSILWLAYGIIIQSWPIIFSDSFGTLTTGILILIKLKYSGEK